MHLNSRKTEREEERKRAWYICHLAAMGKDGYRDGVEIRAGRWKHGYMQAWTSLATALIEAVQFTCVTVRACSLPTKAGEFGTTGNGMERFITASHQDCKRWMNTDTDIEALMKYTVMETLHTWLLYSKQRSEGYAWVGEWVENIQEWRIYMSERASNWIIEFEYCIP